ncbi:MAG TPA: Nramp family divalent metal transporter [Pirellulales bacterium]|nr:Nramp family divalent metal transporter [Pirellulales bacterium]
MTARPQLPKSVRDWVRVFGPGAIIASLTIGTGELIFSTRGGALFGYHILFVFAVILLLKWGLVIATSRHMILTGVHPYRRMIELPGPRGWLPIMLLMMSVVCMPIWISFHSGVLGNLTSWVTGTRDVLNGGMDYVWGAGILLAALALSATGGYSVLERVQMGVVFALVFCAGLTLILYQPDWLELLLGLLPARLEYPAWLPEKYPEIARHSVWVETTRYVGVLGGAGFDYLAYTSWLREKSWGVLPGQATAEQLAEIAADPKHEVRKWINAPLIDCAISFALVVAFSAVFVVSGAMILGPGQVVPDEDSLLNLQARFVTRIQPLLLPLYVVGAFLTMIGTLYGTIEIACIISDEIVRSFFAEWREDHAKRLRRIVLGWCAPVALMILAWLFVRQASPVAFPEEASVGAQAMVSDAAGGEEPAQLQKPRLLLAILTPVNLFTGVLACGLICLLVIWMDRRWLPAALWPPIWLRGLNAVSAVVFLALGLKGYWDNENRTLIVGSMAGIVVLALVVSVALGKKLNTMQSKRASSNEEPNE